MNIEDLKVKEDLRILFMGTPDFAVPVLQGLIDNYTVRAVVTQPDKARNKAGELLPTPVKKLANDNTILVLQPEKLKDSIDEIISLKPNLIITCAYGQLVPRELLVYPKYGCINVHASLLPKLRGGAPIHRAILEGNKKTGITIMHMNPYLDEGDIITQREVEITFEDTASSLHDKLSAVGRDLLLDTLPSIIDGSAPRIPQVESEATFAFNITPEDERINFNKTKTVIYNQIRGLNSFPGAYAMIRGKRMKVWEARITEEYYPGMINGTITKFYPDGIGVKVENGEIVLTKVQPEGKPKMKASDFINGIQNKEEFLGDIFM